MDHAKKMPGGTSSMMSGRKTLGSMMNPQPMQFAMGAKMYQKGQKAPMKTSRPNSQQMLFEKFAQGYIPQTMSELEMFKKFKSGDFATPPPTNRKDMEMGRMLKEYLKGGKSDAGLKALAASNPNLTYKEAMNGMRLIKDPVGMKSAGEGRKMYRHGGAHNPDGSPVQNPFDRVVGDKDDQAMADIQERAMIRRGDASSATPGEGVTLAFGEGSPVDFSTVRDRFKKNNPDLFDPSKDYELLDGEKVFYKKGIVDPEDPEGFFQRVVMPADTRGLKRESTDTYGDILDGLMAEFDDYVASFGDEVKNDPEAIQKAREAFKERARIVAQSMEDKRYK